MPPAAAALPEELVEEILLRCPPDEPAGLFRASLVCKPWCRLISGPRFRRRYREFHRTPPTLGFLCGSRGSDGAKMTRFVPTSATRSPLADLHCCHPIDAHHGRVLLRCLGKAWWENFLMVWDPVSDERRELELPIPTRAVRAFVWDWNAAVLCAAYRTCGHLDCHRGPFIIVFVGCSCAEMLISTYSSDTGTWSDTIFRDWDPNIAPGWSPCAHVGNAVYFHSRSSETALKYDLYLHEPSVIVLPPTATRFQPLVLTSTADGGLGCATVRGLKLYVWSRKDDSHVDAEWTQDRVVDLEMPLPSNAISIYSTHAVGFKDGNGVVFVRSGGRLFTVDLKTKNLKQIISTGGSTYSILPYMTFYTPALGEVCRGEGPSAGGSNA